MHKTMLKMSSLDKLEKVVFGSIRMVDKSFVKSVRPLYYFYQRNLDFDEIKRLLRNDFIYNQHKVSLIETLSTMQKVENVPFSFYHKIFITSGKNYLLQIDLCNSYHECAVLDIKVLLENINKEFHSLSPYTPLYLFLTSMMAYFCYRMM